MKKYLTHIQEFKKDAAEKLDYAKQSVGFGTSKDLRKWRKEQVDYWEAISFCLEVGEEKLNETFLLKNN